MIQLKPLALALGFEYTTRTRTQCAFIVIDSCQKNKLQNNKVHNGNEILLRLLLLLLLLLVVYIARRLATDPNRMIKTTCYSAKQQQQQQQQAPKTAAAAIKKKKKKTTASAIPFSLILPLLLLFTRATAATVGFI